MLAVALWSIPRFAVDPEEQVVMGELRATVHRELRQLPTAERAVLTLHYLLDQDVETIASTLNCSVGTVKSRLYRARAHLRSRLQASAVVPTAISVEA